MNARIMQILAALARKSALQTLHTLCETQHQVSTHKLERYLDDIGDVLAGYAYTLRVEYDALQKSHNAALDELAALKGGQEERREWPDDDIVAAWKWCDENGGTPAEFLSYSLLGKRSRVLGRPLTWREAIELTHATTDMPDAQRDKLLAMDDAPPAQASAWVAEGWPTDDMVVRGAEELHDCLRQAGVKHDFDANLGGTAKQQEIVEQVFKAMLAAAGNKNG